MTKILMLITSLAGGGAERVPSELSLNLSNDISRRIVILKSKVAYPSDQEPLSMGFDFRTSNLYTLLHMLIIGTIKYRQLIKKNKPDVSMSFLVLDNFVNLFSNIFNKNIKVIISVHATLSMKFNDDLIGNVSKYLIKNLYHKADIIVAVSEGVREELITSFGLDSQKTTVIYNPVDTHKINNLLKEDIEEKWYCDGTPTIINVGRLAKPKGQWHLIRAFSKVRSQKICRLCIVGEGPLRSILEKLISDLNLSNDVRLLGWKENPYKYMNNSSWFVLSSVSEALPYSLIESMACGCPIISTDCKYGPREILGDNQYGLLVPRLDFDNYDASEPLSPEEDILANVIIENIDNEGMRKKYSELSYLRSLDFDISKIVRKYEQIIN